MAVPFRIKRRLRGLPRGMMFINPDMTCLARACRVPQQAHRQCHNHTGQTHQGLHRPGSRFEDLVSKAKLSNHAAHQHGPQGQQAQRHPRIPERRHDHNRIIVSRSQGPLHEPGDLNRRLHRHPEQPRTHKRQPVTPACVVTTEYHGHACQKYTASRAQQQVPCGRQSIDLTHGV